MREIQLNMYHALALGAVMYWLGAALTRKLPALRRFCVPAPLVGGLCFALFNTLLYASGLAVITFDETLETVFMILFFTTVGFTVSIPMLVKSGRSVMLLLALSIVIILLQNAVGSGVMALMGKNPLYGLGCGSISMIGGPGTAAAIGPDLDAGASRCSTPRARSAARPSPLRRRPSASFSVPSSAVPSPVILLSKTICARSFPRAASTRRTPTTRTSPRTPTALCSAF